MSSIEPNIPNTPAENPPAPESNGNGTKWITAALCCLIVIPILAEWLPSEVAMWKQAAARNHWNSADRVSAMKLNTEALSWDDSNPTILSERAEWQAELGKYDLAISIYENLLQGMAESEQTISWRMQLCNHYNSLAIQEQREATQTWHQWELIDRWYQQFDRERSLPTVARANLYNNRAYLLAVGNTHFPEALESINFSLDLFGGEIYCLYNDPLFLVQFAYQAFREKNYAEARKHLNSTVDQLERRYALLLATTPANTWKAFEKKELAHRTGNLALVFGNVLLFRAHCLEMLQIQEQSNQTLEGITVSDLERAQILGASVESFSPDIFSSELLLSADVQSLIPMALDTRGYTYYQLGYHHLALQDLEVAVEASEYQLKQIEKVIEQEKHRIADPAIVSSQQQSRYKNLAVILYHRSLAYDATHQVAKAKRDRDRIESLGYAPSPLLH